MGQKVHPTGLRLGINRTWDSLWYTSHGYAKFLHEDLKIRRYIMKRLQQTNCSRVIIERTISQTIHQHSKADIHIYTAKPGMVIGKKGGDIENLRMELSRMSDSELSLNIKEIRKPDMDAHIIAEMVADQLERRVGFRRAMKRAIQAAIRTGAGGIRIICSGRLGGTEIARMEAYREGRVPLHTLRADVDLGMATAKTASGTCGVKVWVFKGEILTPYALTAEKST